MDSIYSQFLVKIFQSRMKTHWKHIIVTTTLALGCVLYFPYASKILISRGVSEQILGDYKMYLYYYHGIPRLDWWYKDYCKYIFAPEFPPMVWYGILCTAYLFIAWKLCVAHKYGWIVALLSFRVIMWSVIPGNIYVLLIAVSSISIWGVLVAGLVKPQLLLIGGVVFLVDSVRNIRKK